jgi:hypothetical protein
MTRTEILTRYRRLRQISKEHHRAVLDIVAPDVVLDWAKRLGLTQGRTVVLDSEHEMLVSAQPPGLDMTTAATIQASGDTTPRPQSSVA